MRQAALFARLPLALILFVVLLPKGAVAENDAVLHRDARACADACSESFVDCSTACPGKIVAHGNVLQAEYHPGCVGACIPNCGISEVGGGVVADGRILKVGGHGSELQVESRALA